MTHSPKTTEDFYWGWGSPDQKFDPKSANHFLQFLKKEFQLKELPKKSSPTPLEQISIPPTSLPQEFIDRWASRGLSVESYDRLSHAKGKSYRDLVCLRAGKDLRFPDGVLFLQEEGDLNNLFEEADRLSITIIPFGGGTGVVGGTDCLGPKERPILVVDLKKLNRLVTLDEISQTATFQAGILGPDLEAVLNQMGYTLGHFPQSFEFSTLGGWAATRSAGQNSTKYGKIEKMVESLKIQTPQGVIETHSVPASASGPGIKDILIGSEGIFGIITEVTVKIWKIPEEQKFLSAFFPNFESGVQFVRKIMQAELRPSIVRLSDSNETRMLIQIKTSSSFFKKLFLKWFLKKRVGETPCFLMIAAEGPKDEVSYQIGHLKKLIKKSGGVGAPSMKKEKWEKDRFRLPYLRDNLMDHSFFIDTLETAAKWSRVEELYTAMVNSFSKREKEKGEKLSMGCHLSHAYSDGASLYFTFLGQQRVGEEIPQWNEIKIEATETILNHGGTLSHHHGIGYDHRRWMERESGVLGLEVFRQIKTTFDPNHLLNPEKII